MQHGGHVTLGGWDAWAGPFGGSAHALEGGAGFELAHVLSAVGAGANAGERHKSSVPPVTAAPHTRPSPHTRVLRLQFRCALK